MTALAERSVVPRAGMLATVRNRPGLVAGVEPFDGEQGRLHLVHLEYKDGHAPLQERLLWELEPGRSLLAPNALPDPARGGAMPPEDFDALLRAARWTALSPYLDPDGAGPLPRQPVASPFHGGLCIENYQLVPLLKALRMPRVSLLIADDVGLGKTVEAGLILTELLLRRRIRRVLVLTPASLRQQWREELWDKFALRFELVDRQGAERLRRKQGMDANPWRSFSHIVASYHYLRQPDILQQFTAACQAPEGSPHLPWDLLIVDECHNLMPAPFGEDSELCRMLRIVAPHFEHRLFLSATPHNGHTRSFTGLLEMLDPVRFTRTNELTPAMRGRIEDVLIRRLKRDINAGNAAPSPHDLPPSRSPAGQSAQATPQPAEAKVGPAPLMAEAGGGSPLPQTASQASPQPGAGSAPRFRTRHPPQALSLDPDPLEAALSAAFDAFRRRIRALVSQGAKARRRAGTFAVEILGKRLLSCPAAFAESWRRAKQGFADQSAASESELAAAQRALQQETGDDREAQQRQATAASVVGAWLKNFADEVAAEIHAIERALAKLGFALDGPPITEQTPLADKRLDALAALIERLLLADGTFRSDERLIVFTEYKTTLDYLVHHLRGRYPEERILTLFGAGGPEGMDETSRENVKAAFNDPASQVRILIATDAASEGLNLHRTARYLLHYDCPWNPSRLEQRNGRLDRYGQARDIAVHHFVSNADPDLRFLDHLIRKADEIREDLGAVNELFDRAAHRRLIQGEEAATVQADLDQGVAAARQDAALNASAAASECAPEDDGFLEAMAAEIDLDDQALRDTLESAMAMAAGRPQLQADADPGFHRILHPDLPGWGDLIDATVRRSAHQGVLGAMPRLAFSPEPFIERLGRLSLFMPRRDALLMHLAHPLMQRALGALARRRHLGAQGEASRWTVRLGGVPEDADALVLLSLEELGVNELRETFHRWVRTLALPVRDGNLAAPLPHAPAKSLRNARPTSDPTHLQRAGEILEDASPALRNRLNACKDELTVRLRQQLQADGSAAREREDERYRQRQGELSALIEQSTLARLSREIEQLSLKKRQGGLFDEDERLAEIEQSIQEKEEELKRRRRHYEEIRAQLQRERTRILEHLLPARFTLAGDAQVFPVAVEVRLPEGPR